MHPGAGHTKGDTVVWVPSEKVLFSGDLVECDAACYTGDAQLEEWPATLEALRCLLYTSDAADERSSVDLGGRRIIKKKT